MTIDIQLEFDIKILKNATIMPLEGIIDSFTGGVFSSNGEFIEDSVVISRAKQPELSKDRQQLDGTYIYGGCLFTHFGHCIWDSLARLYVIKEYKDYPILFIASRVERLEELTVFFESLGFTNKVIVVNVPAQVKNLIYSSPGSSVNPLYITDEQISALQCFSFSPKAHFKKKIWLSRSLLPTGRVTNERVIERLLVKIGYEIIHPENLPLEEQVRLISTSDIVAGFWGSAFYSAFFAKKIHGNFFLFNRDHGIPKEFSYFLEKKGIEFSMHLFNVELVNSCIGGSSAGDDYIHKEPHKIIEVLR